MDKDSIFNWITHVEAAPDPTSLPKPAPNLPEPAPTSTPKKRRQTENSQDVLNEFDLDATPRQGTRSIPSSAASLSSEASSMSRSSLVKGDNQGLSPDEFDNKWQYSFKSANKPDTLPGWIPSITQIKIILARATECENGRHEEASWNALVHFPLLQFIFENNLARPHQMFKPDSSSAKIINICVYTALNQYPELDRAIKAFSNTTPTRSINHTDCYALQFRPVIISIKTKQPGGGEWDRAQLQMGVWHAAQWKFLR
ncbi:hypothetical protein GGI35DRAFT_472884 [Trichoderma velutinum]